MPYLCCTWATLLVRVVFIASVALLAWLHNPRYQMSRSDRYFTVCVNSPSLTGLQYTLWVQVKILSRVRQRIARFRCASQVGRPNPGKRLCLNFCAQFVSFFCRGCHLLPGLLVRHHNKKNILKKRSCCSSYTGLVWCVGTGYLAQQLHIYGM